ncbi:MAG: GreA/GreB family elongation factor [Phycisphaerae bacterium]
MNLKEFSQWIAAGSTGAIEGGWLSAMEANTAPSRMREVLDLLAKARHNDLVETLAGMLLEDRIANLEPEKALVVIRAIFPAMSGENQEIRDAVAETYTKVYGEVDNFQTILKASGIQGNQSPRRAIQTLDTCLKVKVGGFVVNRFEHQACKVKEFDDIMEEWVLVDHRGGEDQLDCRLLGDEWDPADPRDFRVLSRFAPDKLKEMLQQDPAEALIGICISRGGSVNADQLKDLLVGPYLPQSKWSSWWGRARTAIKKADTLTVEGRPALVEYHPGGRTLEEELAPAVEKAILPEDYFDVLQTYLREAQQRGLETDDTFVNALLETLARQAREYIQNRPADALTAALALDTAAKMGYSLDRDDVPRGTEIITHSADPAAAIAELPEPSLRPAAYRALEQREDSTVQFARLLTRMPVAELDVLAQTLREAGHGDAVEQAVGEAIVNVAESLHICLWLWAGPAEPVRTAPSRLDLLGRLLAVMQELHIEHDVDRDFRREACQQIRSAFAAADYAGFREAMEEMDEGVARAMKRRIERSPGLSASTREAMLQIMREKYYTLFLKEKVEPWLDESVVYLTAQSLRQKESELKELTEVTIPANSRAIGEAAQLGDLSENGEWQYAIEERRRLLGQVAQIQDDMARARIIEPRDIPTDKVGIGSKVTVRKQDGGDPVDLTFLGPWETDVQARVYSYKTPVAQALMGHTIGDAVTLKVDGDEAEYVIEAIAPSLSPTV